MSCNKVAMNELNEISKQLEQVIELFSLIEPKRDYIALEIDNGIDEPITIDEIVIENRINAIGNVREVLETCSQTDEINPKEADLFDLTEEEYVVNKGPLYKFVEYPLYKYVKSKKFLANTIRTNSSERMKRREETALYIGYLLYEIYRISIGSFLILFVQQQCGNSNCSTFENIFVGKPLYDATFIINIICFLMFISVYIVEVIREEYMKKELIMSWLGSGIIGLHILQDTEKFKLQTLMKDMKTKYKVSVENHPILDNSVSNRIKSQIEFNNDLYKYVGISTFIVFFINIILSSTTIILYNLDNQKSILGLITNTLIIAPKFIDIFSIAYSKKVKTYSASNKTFSDYNSYSTMNYALIEKEITSWYKEFLRENNIIDDISQ
jgi:hypothetical protein